MISTIDVQIQASNPCMPLYPWRAFVGSPSSLRIRNVPKKIGTWQITSVDVQVEYPDNSILRQPAKLVGGVWLVTLDGASSIGISKNGYTVLADGIDENGDSVSDYILGKGDVEILNSNSIIEAGIKVNSVKIYDEKPEELKDGDAWLEDATLVIFQDGNEYRFDDFNPSPAQQNAINSGITSTKVSNYDRVYSKVPVQTFENDNMLADKAFVNSSVQTATANFRGNWPTFEDVPSNANDYPEDYLGVRTPSTNDYMVVEQRISPGYYQCLFNNGTLAFTFTPDVEAQNIIVQWHNGIKETVHIGEQTEVAFYNSDVECYIYFDENYENGPDWNNIEHWYVDLYDYNDGTYTSTHPEFKNSEENLGTWRYKYVGKWDVDGKNGWKPEYRVNETPMTADQLAAINSGITKQAVQSISNAIPKYKFIEHSGDNNVELTPFTYTIISALDYPSFSVFAQPSDSKDVVREFGLIVLGEATSISWPSNFHPKTEDVFTTILGVNVFWVSEYLPNEFIVSRWSVEDDKAWCLCFTVENAGTTVSMTKGSDAPEVSLLASLDGVTWNEFIPGSTTITLANAGDKVYFKAGEGGNKGLSSPTNHQIDGSNQFNVSGRFAASGSVMSLLDGENHTTTIEQGGAFGYLFYSCPITQAPALPATTLAEYCYYYMFGNCASLIQAPALPATTLAEYCYRFIFYGCTSLMEAPELPATTLANFCYSNMFDGCTSLTQAPALPATTLANFCYYSMFNRCMALTQAPVLPASTLASSCYGYMFKDCTSLTQAPELPATTLVYLCYYHMFENCTKLNNINVNFSAWSTSNWTERWVNKVSSSGTFTCPADLPKQFGISKIPTGWRVVEK